MEKANDRRLIVIAGPTASGKSALAVELALRLGTEVISADSRQVYRGIPIATAQPSEAEMGGVAHHFIACKEPADYYSAALFEEEALAAARRIMDKFGTAVVAGGSMMYVDALCNGIDLLPTVPCEIRETLLKELELKGTEWILAELKRLDPGYYAEVDRKNLKRVVHAVEIIRTAGRPYSSLRTGRKAKREFGIVKLMTDIPRDRLFNRINARVDAMVEAGLEEEARNVYPMRSLNSLNTVGLKEMFAWFDGLTDRDTAIARIKKNTRVYAKKQNTWWQRDPSWHRIDPSEAIRALEVPGIL